MLESNPNNNFSVYRFHSFTRSSEKIYFSRAFPAINGHNGTERRAILLKNVLARRNIISIEYRSLLSPAGWKAALAANQTNEQAVQAPRGARAARGRLAAAAVARR